jgi:FtsZ-interacting cell division protein ZipA
MGGAVILNWVLGAIIIVLIVGGGLYAALRHGKAGPNTRDARRYFRAKDDPQVTPLAEHVPTERVAAAGGLTHPRSPRWDASPERDASPDADADAADAQPRTPVPGDQAAEPGRAPQ